MTWLTHHWYGFLLVQLKGFSPERFLNLCSANEIEIWNLRQEKDGCQFYMTVRGFKKVRPFARKSKVRLGIIKKFGLPFFLYRNRKRKLFFAGFCCFFLVLFLMSGFIWDIEFNGNRRYTYDTLIEFFETQNIRYGMKKSEIDCEALESAIRSEFTEITWVSARVSGTRLLVQIKENEVLSKVPEKDVTPCDLVASKSGVITRMIVRNGTPMVKIGDTVEQGQVLVSGIIPVTNDAEEVVINHYIHADADIYARTEWSYQKSFPLLHQVLSETGKKRTGCYIKVFDYSMLMILPKKAGTSWKILMEEQQLKLFQNFYLPVYLGKITGKEYITYERFYTEDEAKQLAETMHQNFLEKLIEKGVQILENNVKILRNESDCQIEGHIITEEKIGQIQSITEPEETRESDERN